MNSYCFTTAIATLIWLGLSAPAFAQSADDAQPSADIYASKAAETASEWQLRPRWRVQYDVASIGGPDGLAVWEISKMSGARGSGSIWPCRMVFRRGLKPSLPLILSN